MNNLRFATAVHILVLLDKFKGQLITSEFIAGSINVNAVVVRREIKVLREAHYILAKKGKEGGLCLAIAAKEILLGDLYKLVNQQNRLGRMNQPNPLCSVGKQMNGHLDTLFNRVDRELHISLNEQSLADFSAHIA